MPTVSVVVPTRDRPEALAHCLAALAGQTTPPGEVVVVDDGSLDAAAVEAVVERHPLARLVRARGDGPAAARNRGARAAAGDVVAFTDDDCRPGPGWVAAITAAGAAGAEAVAGPTRNGRPRSAVAAASQAVTNHLAERSLDPGTGTVGFAPTSSIAVRASVHRRVPFDESYPLAAGEDRDWCARLAQAGVALTWAPDAWVDHHQDLDLRAFWRQQARYGRGAQRFHEGRGRQPLGFYLALVRRGFVAGPAAGVLVLLSQVATVWGVVVERRATRGDR